MATITPVPVVAGGSSSRAHALGPVGPGRRWSARRRRLRPRSSGRASSKTMGASGSGNSSFPRTGTGGTTRSVSPPDWLVGTTRTGRTVGGPIRSDRCSSVPRAVVVVPHRVGSLTPGPPEHDDRDGHHHQRPRPRAGRSTSRLFNPKTPSVGKATPAGRARRTGIAVDRPRSEAQTAVTEVSPPSTVRWVPVMNEASSERRNRMGRRSRRGGDPPERCPLLELLAEAGQLEGRREHRGGRRPRAHGVDPEPLHGVALGDRAHDAEHPTLRCAVGGEEGLPNSPSMDEMSTTAEPGPASRNGAEQVAGDHRGGPQVDVERGVPDLVVDGVDGRGAGHPGGVDEAAQGPEGRRAAGTAPLRAPPVSATSTTDQCAPHP